MNDKNENAEDETITLTIKIKNETYNLCKWFTKQYTYFNDIIEDNGITKTTKTAKTTTEKHKYLKLDIKNTPLEQMINTRILIFLYNFSNNYRRFENLPDYLPPDNILYKMIKTQITEKTVEDLFQILITADYLGNTYLAQNITEIYVKHVYQQQKFDKHNKLKSMIDKTKRTQIIKHIKGREIITKTPFIFK